MKINIFQGARRLALVVALIPAFVGLFWHMNDIDSQSVQAYYSIDRPGASPKRLDGSCPDEALLALAQVHTKSGTRAWAFLCVLPVPVLDAEGQRLYPYKIDGQGYLVARSGSLEVDAYISELSKSVKLSPVDHQALDDQKATRYRQLLLFSLGIVCVALLVFWGLVWVVGWIVRGFMGIPRGSDHRPE